MNDIEKEFESEVITHQSGVIGFDACKAMLFVYKHYYVFGLASLKVDDRYNFIMNCLPVLERAARTYSPDVCPPFAYVSYLIRVQKKTWMKEKRNERFSEIANENISKQFYEEAQKLNAVSIDETLTLKKNDDPWLPRRVLLVALLCSWYLTDRHIKKLSLVTKIDEETLRNYIDTLNCGLEKKALRIEEESEKLTRNYCRHRRLEEEKAATEKESENFENLCISAEKQREKWERSVQNTRKLAIRTPMSDIAKLLGINQKTALRSVRTFFQKYDGFTLFDED